MDYKDIASEAGFNVIGEALTNPLSSWSGDSSKNKQKKLMHYQDVLNQKSLTESPSSMRLGYETAGFSPALALGQSSPTVGLGSSSMANKNNPFNDLLTKNQQRKLMQSQAELQKIHNFTDMVDSLGKNVESLEKAGFDVSGMFKRIANELKLNFPVLKNAPSKVREHVGAVISDLVAGAELKGEQKNTEVTNQDLNKSKKTLTDEQVNTEFTKQDLNQEFARTQDEIRNHLKSQVRLNDAQVREINKLLDKKYELLGAQISNLSSLSAKYDAETSVAEKQKLLVDAQQKLENLKLSIDNSVKTMQIEDQKLSYDWRKKFWKMGLNPDHLPDDIIRSVSENKLTGKDLFDYIVSDFYHNKFGGLLNNGSKYLK